MDHHHWVCEFEYNVVSIINKRDLWIEASPLLGNLYIKHILLPKRITVMTKICFISTVVPYQNYSILQYKKNSFIISFWSYPSVHLVGVFALIFLVTVFKLPTPDKDLVRKVLGDEEMDTSG